MAFICKKCQSPDLKEIGSNDIFTSYICKQCGAEWWAIPGITKGVPF